jgi:hypothetical protein
LPASLRGELERIGVDPARPVDVYLTGTSESDLAMRVSYCAVGRIVSGPAEFTESRTGSAGRNYVMLRSPPAALGLAVAYQDSIGPVPDWAATSMQPLLAIDLWVDVPHTGHGDNQTVRHGSAKLPSSKR